MNNLIPIQAVTEKCIDISDCYDFAPQSYPLTLIDSALTTRFISINAKPFKDKELESLHRAHLAVDRQMDAEFRAHIAICNGRNK